MKIIICSFLVLISSCASRNMWVVSKDESGGVIAYQNYNGLSNDVWLEDVKQRVQCPEAFVMKDWQRKSQMYQNSLILPSTNTYTTNTNSNYGVSNNYGSNLFNINGNSTSTTTENTTQVIPYTEEVAWVEHRYECDWKSLAKNRYDQMSLEEKIELQKNNCLKDNISSCTELQFLYHQAGKFHQKLAIQEKVCDMKNGEQSAFSCLMRANYNILNGQSKAEAISFYKKGCDLKGSETKNDFAKASCAFFAAHTKKKAMLEENIVDLKSKCALENKGDCYDLACLYSVIGQKDSSLKFLRLAFENGFNDWGHVESDPDLISVRKSQDFIKLINEYKDRSPASDK